MTYTIKTIVAAVVFIIVSTALLWATLLFVVVPIAQAFAPEGYSLVEDLPKIVKLALYAPALSIAGYLSWLILGL